MPGKRELVSTKHASFDEKLFQLGNDVNIGYLQMFDIDDNERPHHGMRTMHYPTERSKRGSSGASKASQTLYDNTNAAEESTLGPNEEHQSIDVDQVQSKIDVGTTDNHYPE